MISDVLSDAIAQCELYRREYPYIYGGKGMASTLNVLMDHMSLVQRMLMRRRHLERKRGRSKPKQNRYQAERRAQMKARKDVGLPV
jgi:hypothetical protein